MKNRLFIAVASTVLLYACGGTVRNPTKPSIAHDTLTYTYKKLNARADDCGTKPDSSCTAIDISYPEFKNAPALNDTILRKVITYFPMKEVADTSFKGLTVSFMKSYKDELKLTNRRTIFFTINTKAEVVRQDSDIVTLQVTGYNYTGGAHGGTAITFLNWNTRTNKTIMLSDIFVDGYEAKLNAIAEKIFRKNEFLSDTASLKQDYFFKDAKFSLNNNYLITPLGLRFLYNQYEIKPYAAGQTDLIIPYISIKGLLKPHTVISQYIH